MAVGDDNIADFSVDNYAALEYFVHKALISFPNGSSAGLDGISPQILKDLTAKQGCRDLDKIILDSRVTSHFSILGLENLKLISRSRFSTEFNFSNNFSTIMLYSGHLSTYIY